MSDPDDNYALGVWIDEAWLDTVVVVGITAFILCLMGLSQVCFVLSRSLSTVGWI